MVKWKNITALLFVFVLASSAQNIKTPLEKSEFKQLSSHQLLIEYLNELDEASEILKLETIGKSIERRDIPAVFLTLDREFASNREKKPVVLIFCQQHGDEPSGKEAALLLARNLIREAQNLLQALDLILIPQLNPDGSEAGARRNANQMDLNRNHVVLTEPETRALHRIFRKWMPEVTLDVHEYNAISDYWVRHGFVKDAEQQLGRLSNLNVDSQILDFSEEIFLPVMGTKIRDAGFTFHEYVVGSPFEDDRLRYSTTAINDGRQGLGIYNTLSFILEGKQYGNLTNKIRRRTEGQLAALIAFLETVGENHIEILRIVNEARDKLLNDDFHRINRAFIQMDYFPDSSRNTLTFPIFNLNTWQKQDSVLKNFHGQVRVRKSVRRPYGYVIPASESDLLDLLERKGIQMKKLEKSYSLEIEKYTILHLTEMIEEETRIPYVDLEVTALTREFDTGTVVIELTQPAGNLIPLILEPHSTYSICSESSGRKYKFDHYLRENEEYPVYRLINNIGNN